MSGAASTPFRFAVGAPMSLSTRQELVDHVHMAEDAGYAVATFPDHLFLPLAPLMAAAVAAEATSTLRVGPFLLANDLRSPAVLAKELATLDLLSGGRVEAGVGAGWMADDFSAAGLTFHAASVRIARLGEAVQVLRGAWGPGPYDLDGEHYRITGLDGRPDPVQPGGPPVIIGGGGRKILTLAAQLADTVTIMTGTPGTATRPGATPAELLAERVGWVREAAAASGRATSPELHVLLSGVSTNPDRRAGAQASADVLATAAGTKRAGVTYDVEGMLTSPFMALGTVAQICDQLRALREEHGISFVSVMEPFARAFAPVVAELAGT